VVLVLPDPLPPEPPAPVGEPLVLDPVPEPPAVAGLEEGLLELPADPDEAPDDPADEPEPDVLGGAVVDWDPSGPARPSRPSRGRSVP